MRPLVIKLGGSLATQGTLRDWLHRIVATGKPAVIVPGGGVLADAVRHLQIQLDLPDATAHTMAILAMNQFGHAIAALEPRCLATENLGDIEQALLAERIPVWLPARMCDSDHDIPQDWSITADGLAARLAEKLRCPGVVLIKSCVAPNGHDAVRLAADGIVDPTFATIVARSGVAWNILGPTDQHILKGLLSGEWAKDDRTAGRSA